MATVYGDPLFNNVVSLLHFAGANGDTTTTNVVDTPVALKNGAKISSDKTLFGENCLKLDGLGAMCVVGPSSKLDIANYTSGDPLFGISGVNIEMWVYFPSSMGASTGFVIEQPIPSGNGNLGLGAFKLMCKHSAAYNKVEIYLYFGLNVFPPHSSYWPYYSSITSDQTKMIPYDQWTHIAIVSAEGVAQSGNWKFYINGSLITTMGDNTTALSTATAPLYAKVVANDALSMLMHFNPPTNVLSSDKIIQDLSLNARTITARGRVRNLTSAPNGVTGITGNGLIHFSGYYWKCGALKFAPITLSAYEDFTVELWIYVPTESWNAYDTVLISGNSGNCQILRLHADSVYNKIRVYSDDSFAVMNTTSALSAYSVGNWNHLAITRSGTSTRFFLNGAIKSTATSTTIQSKQYTIDTIGSHDWAMGLPEFCLDGIRITKGVARYTTTFSPSTIYGENISQDAYYTYNALLIKSPRNPITNHRNFIDNIRLQKPVDTALNPNLTIPRENPIIAYGNACIDESVKKFDAGSLRLDGNGDYLEVRTESNYQTYSKRFDFASNNFTIEFFVRFASVPGAGQYAAPFSIRVATNSNTIALLYGGTESWHVEYTTDGTTVIKASGMSSHVPVVDTWYHVALVRLGSKLDFYIDGVKQTDHNIGLSSLYPTSNNQAPILIGAVNSTSPTHFLNGYLDELRVLNGVAAYSSNFTPPTEAFSNEESLHYYDSATPSYSCYLKDFRVTTKADRFSRGLLGCTPNPAAYNSTEIVKCPDNQFSSDAIETLSGDSSDSMTALKSYTIASPTFPQAIRQMSNNDEGSANLIGGFEVTQPPNPTPAPVYRQIHGQVLVLGLPVAREVRAYRRDTGKYLATATSDVSGNFTLNIPDYSGQCYVVALDDDASPDYNALIIDRVVPVTG